MLSEKLVLKNNNWGCSTSKMNDEWEIGIRKTTVGVVELVKWVMSEKLVLKETIGVVVPIKWMMSEKLVLEKQQLGL